MLDYTAPSTVEEAVRILAAAPGTAKVLAGGTDLLVQLRSGRVKPGLIVDIKKIPEISGIREKDGGFVIGAATSGAMIGECEALQKAWPGCGRGHQSDRLDPGAGPRVACRQSLQRLAGGRQRAGDDRRACDLRGRRPEGPARGSGGEYRHGSGAHLAEPGRVHRRVSPAETPAALGRRLSALHPAHRDGHRRGRRGSQRDARRRRRLHRCARRARRRGADRCSSSPKRPRR